MTSQAPQRKSIRSIILVIAAVIFAWTIYQEFRPHYDVGEMEYRLITGQKSGSFEVIMLETAKQFTVLDAEFKDIFENNDAEVITRQEQLKLLQKYMDLQYRVNIHVHVKEEKAQFRLSRENFNKIQFNTKLKYELDRKVKDSIIALVEM